MDDRIIASSVRDIEHIAVFDDIIKQRFDALDKDALFVYLIDIVKSPALIFLADQFDVLGFKGWALANTDADRRNLIKNAIRLHKKKGTPFAIKQAISSSIAGVDYQDITILEHINLVGIFYDGIYTYNGSQHFGPGHWATFRVTIDATGMGPITADISYLIVQLILEYKNVRSWLVDLSYLYPLDENLLVDDTVGLTIYEETHLYDGADTYDGSHVYDHEWNITTLP